MRARNRLQPMKSDRRQLQERGRSEEHGEAGRVDREESQGGLLVKDTAGYSGTSGRLSAELSRDG